MPKLSSNTSKHSQRELNVGEGTESEYNLSNHSKHSVDSGEMPYLWYPTLESVKHIDYVRKLEGDFATLQKAFLAMTTHYARVQFRLRQITLAAPCERDALLCDLEKLAFECVDPDSGDELPRIQRDLRCMGDVRRKQNFMLEKLRNQLSALTEASELEGIEESYTPPQNESVESSQQVFSYSTSQRSMTSSKGSSRSAHGQ